MGLFGNLFSKEPKEVKEYWKAFTALYKKQRMKELEMMEASIKECPDIWQGYFLLGLLHDAGYNDIKADAEKAALYHMQAEKAAKGTADAEWLSSFHAWYRQFAGNHRIPLEERDLVMRRMGVAAMNNFTYMEPVICAHDLKDDAKFWKEMLPFFGSASPFRDYFSAWASYKNGTADASSIRVNTSIIFDGYNNSIKHYNKNFKATNKGKTVSDEKWRSVYDAFAYIFYHTILFPSPCVYESADVDSGIRGLITGAIMGNATCVHELAHLVHSNEENRVFIENLYQAKFDYSPLVDDLIIQKLKMNAAMCGDAEAARLLQVYYGE